MRLSRNAASCEVLLAGFLSCFLALAPALAVAHQPNPRRVTDCVPIGGLRATEAEHQRGLYGSALLHHLVFFVGSDPTDERMLWETDGTREGTVRLGQGTRSILWWPTVAGQTMFVNAKGDGEGSELWASDGTEHGTVLLKRFVPGDVGGNPRYLTPLGNELIFTACDRAHGRELWRSDGTTAGTNLIKDIVPGDEGSHPLDMVSAGSTTFFHVYAGSQGGLWRTDGTTGGTRSLNKPEHGFGSTQLTPVGETLFFVGSDADHGSELWKSDGTTAGTVLVSDLTPGPGGSDPGYLAATNGELYFSASTPELGYELWKSDGTQAGTTVVTDIAPGTESSNPQGFASSGGFVYFAADDEDGPGLWRTDGTDSGTVLVRRFPEAPYGFFGIGENLFFKGNDIHYGAELWRSDGTRSGSLMLRDLTRGPDSSFLHGFSSLDGRLIFLNGYNELWASDGTKKGTILVRNLFR